MEFTQAIQRKFAFRQNELLFLALLIIVAVVAMYWQTYSRIVEMWSLWDYQYGWLVYPVCLYLLVLNRTRLASTCRRTSTGGVLLVGALVLVWLVARAAAVQIVEFVSATLLIFASFWAFAGTTALRQIGFPLLLLLVAVPMGEVLIEPLMRITANIAAFLLALSGIPVLRDNQFFVMSGGTFEIAEVCSGFQYLVAGVLVSLAYVYVTSANVLARMAFVAVTAVIFVIANGVRAFIVMAVASATEMRILGGDDHVHFGTFLFAVVILAMLLLGEKFLPSQKESSRRIDREADIDARLVSKVVIGFTVILLAAGPALSVSMDNRGVNKIADLPVSHLEGCVKQSIPIVAGFSSFQNVDYEHRELFDCSGLQASIYVASYGAPEQGKELIAWGNRIWPNEWRRFVDRSAISINGSDGVTKVNQVLVRHPDGWRLIWYWYQVGQSVTISQTHVKALEVFRVLTLRPAESSVVVLSASSNESDNTVELRQTLEKHAGHLMRWNRERVELGGSQR